MRWLHLVALLALLLPAGCPAGYEEPAAGGEDIAAGADLSLPEPVDAAALDGAAEDSGPDATRAPASLVSQPAPIDFGARLVGTQSTISVYLRAVGEREVTVSQIALASAGEASDFSFGLHAGLPENGVYVPDEPIVLAPGAAMEVLIHYEPAAESTLDPETNTIASATDQLVVHSDADEPRLSLLMTGYGVVEPGPDAVVSCDEGEQVIPQTNLHLDGSGSNSDNGEITKWAWSVVQPPGSVSQFLPSASAPNPTFEANVAGVYTFTLRVWDAEGHQSAVPAVFTINVIPENSLHVELLWTTPGDPDESDTGAFAGSDVDLHFLHPDAPTEEDPPDLDGDGLPDPFFSQPYDCYWFNPHPDWAAYGNTNSDNPGLDRDDTDGAGPENINLDNPEDGTRYRVAVHYWNDHGYGPALITLRVYVHGALVREINGVRLENYDLWDAATIDWPSGEVIPTVTDNGSYRIVGPYQHPMFFD